LEGEKEKEKEKMKGLDEVAKHKASTQNHSRSNLTKYSKEAMPLA
jgi:hypothetical protein